MAGANPSPATVAVPRQRETGWRALRATVANLRAAAETLEAYPEMEIVRRTRLLQVLVEETERLSRSLAELEAADAGPQAGQVGPVPVDELLREIDGALSATGLRVERSADDSRHDALAVVAAIRPLTGELTRLGQGLRAELGVGRARLSASPVERHLRLDLGWPIAEGGAEPTSAWILDALAGQPLASGESCALRELMRELGGEVWFTLDRDGADAHLRLLLPATPLHAAVTAN